MTYRLCACFYPVIGPRRESSQCLCNPGICSRNLTSPPIPWSISLKAALAPTVDFITLAAVQESRVTLDHLYEIWAAQRLWLFGAKLLRRPIAAQANTALISHVTPLSCLNSYFSRLRYPIIVSLQCANTGCWHTTAPTGTKDGTAYCPRAYGGI